MTVALLLDTHALLWWLADTELSADARDRIGDPETTVLVSAVSLLEIGIKVKAGKLSVDVPLAPLLDEEGFEHLALSAEHAEASAALSLHHRDPFDRLLIAQAQEEAAVFVTRDRWAGAYEVEVLGC